MTAWDRLGAFVLRPLRAADERRVGFVRIAIGIAVLATAVETGEYLGRVLAASSLALPYMGPIPRLPEKLFIPFLTVWCLAGLAFLVGWNTRIAGTVLTLVMGYTLIVDQQTYSNHLYLLTCIVLLLTLAGAGAAVSLDARRRSGINHVAAGPVFLLKTQLSVMYAFAALNKISAIYLSGAVLSVTLRWEGPVALPAAARNPTILAIMALSSVVIEAFLAVALWSPKWRKGALVAGVALHLGMIATVPLPDMLAVAIFALASLSLYVLFFDNAPTLTPHDELSSGDSIEDSSANEVSSFASL